LGNGVRPWLNEGTDGRSLRGRRVRELVHDITEDLGGEHVLTSTDLELVRQIAAIFTINEEQRCAYVDSDTGFDADAYMKGVYNGARLLHDLRTTIERRNAAREKRLAAMPMSTGDIIASYERRAAALEDDDPPMPPRRRTTNGRDRARVRVLVDDDEPVINDELLQVDDVAEPEDDES
jgi:hypothetical protein